MTKVEFFLSNENICGFKVKGHSGFAEAGLDIVCAAVSSAVELTANGITEIAKVNATVSANGDMVYLFLDEKNRQNVYAIAFLKALRLHLELLSMDYPDNIILNDMEV